MATEAKNKFKMDFNLKKFGQESANSGLAVLGFSGAHMFYNKVVPQSFKTGWKSIATAAVMFLLGGFIATQTTKEAVKSTVLGWQTYSGVKLVNNVAGIAPEINGLGFVGDGFKRVAQTMLPNLGEATPAHTDFQIFAPGTQIPAEEAAYTLLATEEEGKLNLPDLTGAPAKEITGFLANVA